MIYRSQIKAPDLYPFFKHAWHRPMTYAFDHDVISDWSDKDDDDPVFGIYKRCGFWTHDEAAILCEVAKRVGGRWADIGSHTGWTTAHISIGSSYVAGVDPMYGNGEFVNRALENLNPIVMRGGVALFPETADAWFGRHRMADGFCIDGDHCDGEPQRDAINAANHLAPEGVIMFHDGTGKPVRDAVLYLMGLGFQVRAYYTPHMVFCCWRGQFTPPDHTPETFVYEQLTDGRMSDFPFERCK